MPAVLWMCQDFEIGPCGAYSQAFSLAFVFPVCRLAYNGDVAAGQLAVFQGASDEHIKSDT